MIILVSGTNGAGKTYLMRRVLDLLPREANGECRIQRDRTKSIRVGSQWGHPYDITLLGRYDGPTCGGCDCLSWKGASDDLERLIVKAVQDGQRVLLEGLIVATWGIKRLMRLRGMGLAIVHIAVPLEECLASVNDRRRARALATGKEYTPVKEDNIVSKYRCLQRQNDARRASGITVLELSREQAFQHVIGALGL